MQFFWQGKAQNSSPIPRCTFLARRSAKLIANFSATMMTSLPSFSLSLCISLSLSPNVPHAQYRKRFRASYNTAECVFTKTNSPLLSLELVQKRIFFECSWVIIEEKTEKEKFSGKRGFQTMRQKVVFCTDIHSKSNVFLQFPLMASLRNMQRKSKYTVDYKNKEPGERNVRFLTLILMFIMHEMCKSLEHVKMQNLPWNTPLFLVLRPHLEPP